MSPVYVKRIVNVLVLGDGEAVSLELAQLEGGPNIHLDFEFDALGETIKALGALYSQATKMRRLPKENEETTVAATLIVKVGAFRCTEPGYVVITFQTPDGLDYDFALSTQLADLLRNEIEKASGDNGTSRRVVLH